MRFASSSTWALPSSASAFLTDARTAVSVSLSSRATWPTVLPLVRTSLTISAFYSAVNCCRFLLLLATQTPIFARGWGVHQTGQVH